MYWEMVPQISFEKFEDFFTYYKGTPNQKAALELFWKGVPSSLLKNDSAWVLKYREPEPKKESKIPAAAIDLICEFEGFRENVYDDGVGVPTIGFGSTFYENNDRVAWGDPPITRERARSLMLLVCEDFWDYLERHIPFWTQMTDGQKGCILSFSYNCGKAFYGSSGFNTITNVLSSRNYADIDYALHLYVNPGSPVETGLRRRRDAEYALWCS